MIRLIGCGALSLALAACAENTAAPAPASPASPAAASSSAPTTAKGAKADVKAPGDAKVGDTARCPVSGEEFVVTNDSPKVEYEGKTFYTCCSGCKSKIEADPAKYLKAKN